MIVMLNAKQMERNELKFQTWSNKRKKEQQESVSEELKQKKGLGQLNSSEGVT